MKWCGPHLRPRGNRMQLQLQTFAEVLESLRTPNVAGAGAEKRQSTRFEIQTRIEAALLHGDEVVRRYHALTRDISLRGIGLLQGLPLNRGEQLLVSLPRRGRAPLVILCEVMFAGILADSLSGVGAQFKSLATEAQQRALAPDDQAERRIRESMLA